MEKLAVLASNQLAGSAVSYTEEDPKSDTEGSVLGEVLPRDGAIAIDAEASPKGYRFPLADQPTKNKVKAVWTIRRL